MKIIYGKIVLDKPIIKLQRKFQRENTEKIFSLACSVGANPPAKVLFSLVCSVDTNPPAKVLDANVFISLCVNESS